MTYYQAKFERERKARPQDWVVVPAGRSAFSLIYIGEEK